MMRWLLTFLAACAFVLLILEGARVDAQAPAGPVSVTGTVTANLGTLNGAATAANQEVTAAGSSATSAQGVQGVTGGVPVPVSESGVWQVTPTLPAASTMTLTSSTTAYTSGQLIANNATAGSITNPSFSMPTLGGAIPRIRLISNDTTSTAWANATVQIDLWDAAPTWTNGDHGTWLPATGSTHHIASFSCSFGSAVWGDGLATECTPAQGNYASVVATTVYWSLEATAGSGVIGGSKTLGIRPELN